MGFLGGNGQTCPCFGWSPEKISPLPSSLYSNESSGKNTQNEIFKSIAFFFLVPGMSPNKKYKARRIISLAFFKIK